jgi:hypothetical protein
MMSINRVSSVTPASSSRADIERVECFPEMFTEIVNSICDVQRQMGVGYFKRLKQALKLGKKGLPRDSFRIGIHNRMVVLPKNRLAYAAHPPMFPIGKLRVRAVVTCFPKSLPV